jgi:hypothetical protein
VSLTAHLPSYFQTVATLQIGFTARRRLDLAPAATFVRSVWRIPGRPLDHSKRSAYARIPWARSSWALCKSPPRARRGAISAVDRHNEVMAFGLPLVSIGMPSSRQKENGPCASANPLHRQAATQCGRTAPHRRGRTKFTPTRAATAPITQMEECKQGCGG